METKEWKFVDKSAWPNEGPWNDEPDKLQWPDEATSLPCMIHRGPSGALCGYVGVSEGHPGFKADYDSPDVDVHGGLTFADMCQEQSAETGKGICHIPGEGEPDHVWWFGFDCAHSGDLCPAHDQHSIYGIYRDLRYVKSQVEGLARQLAAQAA